MPTAAAPAGRRWRRRTRRHRELWRLSPKQTANPKKPRASMDFLHLIGCIFQQKSAGPNDSRMRQGKKTEI
jgi:hypothetical protein